MDSLESEARVETTGWSVQTRRTRDGRVSLSDQHTLHTERDMNQNEGRARVWLLSSKGPLSRVRSHPSCNT